jgi:type VI secretion system secreted protein VgrG
MGSNPLSDMLRIGNVQYNRLIKLDTPLGVDWLLPLLVRGTSRLGRDYEFIVDVVTSRGSQIELKALLARAVTLWIRQTDGSYLPFHGYVHRFSRLGGDGPLTYYQLRFSSWLHFLRLRRDMRDWQEQSGEQILSDVFDSTRRHRARTGLICASRFRRTRAVCNGNTTTTLSTGAWKRPACSRALSRRKTGSRTRWS